METLQSKIEELFAESASSKERNASLSNVISAKLEEIRKLEVLVSSLITDAEKSSARIQELETIRDALDEALSESTQPLGVKAKELNEMQSHYNTEKKRLEGEPCALRKANEMLNENLQKEEEEEDMLTESEGDMPTEEDEDMIMEFMKDWRSEEEEYMPSEDVDDMLTVEEVRSSVQPCSNTSGGEASSAVFKPITSTTW
eukprot:CAMPEP_0175048514 /NCGR_PEP_ID=MMETSP0052_2-20121109/6242_1 /TAXON_ID=51329 ORGANISM="Polytomella parva, Strain SAG 63-3" /NCGR_SAMPLE_ID=MMETSP0052_2 /ASSEMBLY_ACC=CAM_ASM_000194 /LENGTH=200 /DNA_ID=CAMNT_0016312607 /DNA_START=42 /DNA_END=641 /DNA_ORIENTATION=+